MRLKLILNNLKARLNRQEQSVVLNDFANDCNEWYQSQEYDELVQAYTDNGYYYEIYLN